MQEMFSELVEFAKRFKKMPCKSPRDCGTCPFNKEIAEETRSNGDKTKVTICDALMNVIDED